MKLSDLVIEIECYAAAKASGNEVLSQRQAAVLRSFLDQLPDELPEKEKPKEPEQ